jgi:tetratricopeptide (TPR) repeat protein
MTVRGLGTVLVLVLTAVVLALVAIGTDRGVAAVLAALAVGFGFALATQADRYDTALDVLHDATETALVLTPGVLLVFFAFNGGGFSPAPVAFVAVVLALVLALRLWFAPEPFAGFGPLGGVAAGLLALYAIWTGLSASWSDAPGRALLEADRVLLYLFALCLFLSLPRSTDRLRLMVRGLAASAVVVCIVGLITRVLPDVWPIGPDLQQGRLSYPVTYWNAFGLVAALAIVWCVHLASSEREPPLVRVLGAAVTPALGAALYFTFSRGAIAACGLGLVAYVLVARPRGLAGGLLATLPTTAIALVTAYDADLLASDNPTSAAATSQGHHVAGIVVLCMAGAAALRLLALPLDRFITGLRLPTRMKLWVPTTAWITGTVIVAGAFFALHGPHRVSDNYDRFVKGNAVVQSGDLRSRLGDPGNNRRIDQWKVAWKGYKSEPFHGLGAGTYENQWNEKRPVRFEIVDAHSLYVEVMSELGLVGLVLLAGALVLPLIAFARGVWRERDRYVYAVLLAALLAWAFRAGLDWDWEMPAITIWLFCASGVAMAVSHRSRRRAPRLRTVWRLALTLVFVAVALVPAAVAVSQHRLEESQAAFRRGDCGAAARQARGSLSVVGFRAEPQEILAFCAARRGQFDEAIADLRKAQRRDPQNWRYRYDEALLTAADGKDATRAANKADQLDPLEPFAFSAPRILVGPGATERARALLRETR